MCTPAALRKMFGLVLVAALFLSGCVSKPAGKAAEPAPAEQPKPKLAMILPGTVQDADYNFVGYLALLELERQFGVTAKYQEQVPPADAERVARGFINDGYTIVAFHGGQYVTTVRKLAPMFPDVTFIAESSGPLPDLPSNVWNIGRKFYQGFYGLGALAALATKSNKIGVVVGIRLPDFVASINAIKQAVRELNPNAEVVYTFVGDQNDPVKARQAAEAQIGTGVDFIILIVNLGAYGVIEAAKETPVLLTTFYTDKANLAPNNFTTSLLLDFAVPYKKVLGQILAGTRGGYEEMRPGNGMALAAIQNVSPETASRVQLIFEQVASGAIQLPEITDEIRD